MNKFNKQLITMVGLIVSLLGMIVINTTMIDPSKYKGANSTNERLQNIFIDSKDKVAEVSNSMMNYFTSNDVNDTDGNTSVNNTVVSIDRNISDINNSAVTINIYEANKTSIMNSKAELAVKITLDENLTIPKLGNMVNQEIDNRKKVE